MLAAKERARDGWGAQEFDFICTYDRDLIVECAQALMLRIAHLQSAAEAPAL